MQRSSNHAIHLYDDFSDPSSHLDSRSFHAASLEIRKKRELEQAVAEAAKQIEGVNVLMIPHLYDLPKGSESYKRLLEVESNLIVVSWIYSRAAHWVLDRNGIQGQFGEVLLGLDEEDDDGKESSEREFESAVDRVTDLYPRPDRNIHCIDLKLTDDTELLVDRRFVESSAIRIPAMDNRQSSDHRRATGSSRRANLTTLVSGDRFQSLHQLHGVCRLLPVWCLRC